MKSQEIYERLLFMLKEPSGSLASQRNKVPLQKFMESKALLNFQVESLIQLRKTTIDEVYELF